jgi:hypothetical protein
MRFTLTHHAQIKCLERNVSEEDIYFTLNNFHMTLPGHHNGIGLFARVPQGDTVIVWIAGSLPLKEPVIVKTVVRRGK